MLHRRSLAWLCCIVVSGDIPGLARAQPPAAQPQGEPASAPKPASNEAGKSAPSRNGNPSEAGTKARAVQANIACPDCHGEGSKTHREQVNLPKQKYRMDTHTETCKSCNGKKISIPTPTNKIPTWMNFLRQTALAVARADPNHPDYDKMRIAVCSALRGSIGKNFTAVAAIVNPEEERASQVVSNDKGGKKNASSGMTFAGTLIKEETIDGTRYVHVGYSSTRAIYHTWQPGDREVVLKDPAFIDAAIDDSVFVGGIFVERKNDVVVLQYGFVIGATELPAK